ncbi:MAG TPA: EamA family transporter [Sphingomicrobium sp.]|nr:EamA family transporter [Sphingomicrobium sp.]
MATLSEDLFEGKPQDAARPAAAYEAPVIRTLMNRSDWLTLIVLALIWGAAFLFISVAVREVEPFTYVWLRLTIAAAAMWLFLWWRGESAGLPRQVWVSILVLALFNNAIPFVLFGWGQTHIASGLAAILNATTPIWGVVVAHLFTHDEKLSGRKLAGVALGFAGVTVMIGPALLGSLGDNVLAQLACVTAALCYAFAGVWARRFRGMGLKPISVTTGQLSAGALVMLPVALLVDRPWLDAMPSLTAIGAIAALAVVCSAFAYILYFRLIDRAGATNALLVTLLVPPVAIFFGSLVLHEVIEPRDFAGLALIALGLAAIDGRLLKAFSAGRPRPAA